MAQTSENRVAANTDWSVFVEANPSQCWAVSAPKETVNTRDGRVVAVQRGDILMFVSYSETQKGVVSFTGGYPFAPGSTVEVQIGSDNFYVNGWPRGEKIDDERVLTVQKAHPFGYTYTHGFDARAKSVRCETCHEQESFCAPCHENGYDATGRRIVPQSHQLAGFALVGGGKAQNRHGRLAMMDIESCVTCHNVEGGDPVCSACHSTGAVTGGMR